VAAGSNHGFELALQWIDSPEENIAAAGWSTLGALVSLKDDSELDLSELKSLLSRVVKNISSSKNRVRYAMNGFVIAVGSYVTALTETAITVAKKIGTVTVEKNETACKVSDATAYILKIKEKGGLGKKKKTVKC
jgi:hypothetical protein